MPSRREFLSIAATAAGWVAAGRPAAAQPADDLWSAVPSILARIAPPRFPDRVFDITTFGAVADRDQGASAAITAAIAACADAGGGRVVIPKGRWVTGPVVLRSNVNLQLEDQATLAFTRDAAAYLPQVFTRYEGVELMNYSPFIYAMEQRNIAITGGGTLDGQADKEFWWSWRDRAVVKSGARDRLFDMGKRGVPVRERVFGAGDFMRPNFIQPYRCQNVLIDGVTVINSPMWEINPVLCTNVIVRSVTVRSHGPNNDGCDPESSKDVLIERCTFDTGDDCIAIKSGRNNDGRRVNTPVENIIVRDCDMRDGHGGVVIGSEISGGARNIFAERCRMDSPRLDRVLRFKTNAERGGVIERVAMRSITVGEVAEAIVTADFYYEEGDTGSFTPALRDVDVRGITSRKSRYALLLRGYERSPITNVRLADCTLDGVERPDVLQGVRDVVLSNVRINGQLRNERITR